MNLEEVGVDELGQFVEPSVPLVYTGRTGTVVVQHESFLVADLPEGVQGSLLVLGHSEKQRMIWIK